MSGEIEAAGALATAGAVGAALEGREGGPRGGGSCPNCEAPIAGRFCSNCGQHAHPNRKLSGVIGEFMYGLWNFDTKAWRTVPMLIVRPGTLTRNYVYGKRARYLAPLTMFLFAIFLMFFAFSTIQAPTNIRDSSVHITQRDLDEARAGLAEAQTELANARAHPDPDEPAGLEVTLAENAVRLAQQEVDRSERQLAQAQAREARRAQARANTPVQVTVDPSLSTPATTAEAPATTTEGAAPTADAPPAAADDTGDDVETWQDGMREVAENDNFVVFGNANSELNERVRRKFANPDLALYQVQDAASKFSFLLAPLSLPFIALLFLWKRGVTLYDHMAYALYALAFAAILFSAVVLLGEIPWISWASAWLLLALPVHMYFHLKGAYALGWWSAVWRTFFMLNFAFIVASTFTVLVIVLGLAG
ncbi:DUF3667 domain-containing protein [Candidatus Viadribacter manganicus]|uniref:DUF3667 domain-containing protein n=1 Tax=Candidatus Viadribacter manganicus TaxID=1759059 RepID=A0A1B1ALM5_9PROT|nr:DUF3667 domain-containing protein [Candidatus Viadribacter manganicus]ANP47457.1 hypothetical protein ATE48_16850 [Candidatus Viadribacter manganicus]